MYYFPLPYYFPLSHQPSAPNFDGKNVTDFVTMWEDLTVDWTDETRIKKVPLYCDRSIGRYIRAMEAFQSATSWTTFKKELLKEFRYDDDEQKRSTEIYLQSIFRTIRDTIELRPLRSVVQAMHDTIDPTPLQYRHFISDFSERADQLVTRGIINEHTRVLLFLQAFSDKIGDKLCKKCSIDIADPETTRTVWPNLKKEALSITKHGSQMRKLREMKQFADIERRDESRRPQPQPQSHTVNTEELNKVVNELLVNWIEIRRGVEQIAELKALQTLATAEQDAERL